MERWKSTRELTIESVELIQERRVTVAQVARDLGVQETVLSRWVQESAADAQQAFQAGGRTRSAIESSS